MKKPNGKLFVIVGASGVGKDTLLNEIKRKLTNFHFVKRYITRTLDKNSEDHIPISNTDFQNKVKDGFFAISWQAHSLSYGIPKDIEDELANIRRKTSEEIKEENDLKAVYASIIAQYDEYDICICKDLELYCYAYLYNICWYI